MASMQLQHTFTSYFIIVFPQIRVTFSSNISNAHHSLSGVPGNAAPTCMHAVLRLPRACGPVQLCEDHAQKSNMHAWLSESELACARQGSKKGRAGSADP